MSEEKKESEVESKPTEDTASDKSSTEKVAKTKAAKEAKVAVDATTSKADAAAKAAEKAEIAAQKAIAKAAAAKEKAESAAEAEYKAIADEVKEDAVKGPDYTFKRQGEEIFRREMGEPEFWLDKKDRFPRPILSAEEQESITREAERFQDVTPNYVPEHVLSPEFGGVSNYEKAVDTFIEESKQILKKLKNDPEATEKQIKNAKNDIIYLKSLHENFYIGMNVFRTAKGGRDKIKS
jgi:colicin import membrane protein